MRGTEVRLWRGLFHPETSNGNTPYMLTQVRRITEGSNLSETLAERDREIGRYSLLRVGAAYIRTRTLWSDSMRYNVHILDRRKVQTEFIVLYFIYFFIPLTRNAQLLMLISCFAADT